MAEIELRLVLDGVERAARAHPLARLLDVLRDQLGATSVKEGCGEGECGACAVLLDGRLVNSCLVPAAHAAGAGIETVRSLAEGEELGPLQRVFLEAGAAQCGICTPGMLLAAEALLRANPRPTREEVSTALAGNLCRCTGHTRIVAAVLEAAAERRRQP